MIDHVLLHLTLAASSAGDIGATDVQREYERWERRLRARVAELHVQPGGADGGEPGDVTLRFSIGSDGRPRDAVILKSSGDPTYDRAARRVVRLLGPIGPVPSLAGANHQVRLKLSYGQGSTPELDDKLTAELESERRAYAGRNLRAVTGPAGATALGKGD